MSDSDAWCSPPEIADPLADFHGGPVDIDPCSNEQSIILARMAYTHSGLVLPWCLKRPVARSGYQNDPYSQAEAWTVKMLTEFKLGNVREHIRLCMMSTSSRWWSMQCMLTRRNPRILALKRIPFLRPPNLPSKAKNKRAAMTRQGCRFEPALIYFGPRAAAFTKTFAHLTRWTTWGRT